MASSLGTKLKSIPSRVVLRYFLGIALVVALFCFGIDNKKNQHGAPPHWWYRYQTVYHTMLWSVAANTNDPESMVHTDHNSNNNNNDNNNNMECEIGPDGTCLVKNDGNSLLLPGMTIKSKDDDDGSAMVDTGFGVDQQAVGAHKENIMKRFQEIQGYMKDRVLKASTDDVLSTVASDCQLRHELCTFWAVIGECEANPGYMKIQCAPACFTCEQLSFDTRCPMPENLTDVFCAGGLNQMFDRIVTDPYYQEQYTIEVLARPNNDTTKIKRMKDMPWVVTIDNFLTDEECDTLIRLGGELGYQQSLDVGTKKFDGTFDAVQSPGRTSTNAWCQDACFDHPITKRVLAKIENVTGVPDDNSEYLQLLKYEKSQFYQQHHDYIDFHTKRAQGVRILTVFLYLNDVEKGGGTNFPKLSLTVMPKRGRALIWPSVLDENPSQKDPRTDHQALPVEEGVKYGANAWLHLRDFKTPHKKNCI